jgi:hypothetical protein
MIINHSYYALRLLSLNETAFFHFFSRPLYQAKQLRYFKHFPISKEIFKGVDFQVHTKLPRPLLSELPFKA